MDLLLQPVQVPLDGFPSFLRIDCTTQLGVICKLAEGALHATVCVTDEDVEEHRSQDRPLRDTTCDRPPLTEPLSQPFGCHQPTCSSYMELYSIGMVFLQVLTSMADSFVIKKLRTCTISTERLDRTPVCLFVLFSGKHIADQTKS